MRTSHTFSSLLLLTSALMAPSAIAQTSEQADPAPATTTPPLAEEQPVDVPVPGASFDGEIVVTGRFIHNLVRSTPHVVSATSNEAIKRAGDADIAGALQSAPAMQIACKARVLLPGLPLMSYSSLLSLLPSPPP